MHLKTQLARNTWLILFVMIAMLAVVVGASYFGYVKVRHVLETQTPVSEALSAIEINVDELAVRMLAYILSPAEVPQQAIDEAKHDIRRSYDRIARDYDDHPVTPETLSTLRAQLDAFVAISDRAITLVDKRNLLSQQLAPQTTELKDTLSELHRRNSGKDLSGLERLITLVAKITEQVQGFLLHPEPQEKQQALATIVKIEKYTAEEAYRLGYYLDRPDEQMATLLRQIETVTVGSTRLLNATQAIDEAGKEVLAAIATFDHFIDTLQEQASASAHQSAHTLLGLAKLLPIVVLALGLGALAISYVHSNRTARSLDAGMNSILQGIEGVRSGRSDLLLQVQEPSEFRLTASFLADVARERDEADKAIQQLLQESEAARSILAEEREVMEGIFLAMRETKQYDGRHVRDLQVPVERTSGDVLFSAFRPDGTQHVFLGDFTGHGLTAALGGPLVSDVFYTMTRKGFEATQLIEEMSARLAERLPVGVFLAAIMVTISLDRRRGGLVNCGMQDALLFRNNVELHRFRSNNLALGISADMPISEDTLTLEQGDKLYIFSDGLVEVEDENGRQFGIDRLSEAISDMLQHDGALEDVEAAAMRFGHLEIAPDDKTMAEVTC